MTAEMPGSAEQPVVRMQGVSKAYGETVALDNVDLDVHRGEMFAVIGPDGAGKTSLLRIVAGITRADTGELTLLGAAVSRVTRDMKGRIGYLAQGFALYRDLSVEENLTFFGRLYGTGTGQRATSTGRGTSTTRSASNTRGATWREELLDFTRLGPFRRRLAGHLSGGMKKKLALACALIHRPELIVLDEPTTGVDPVSRREFWTILNELKHDGLTIIVSTPYMDEADRCDRVALLRSGRVLATGSPGEITSRVGGSITEIVTAGARKLRTILIDQGYTVQIQGNRIHVYDADSSEAIRSVLAEAGIAADSVSVMPPSMEDAYIALQEQ
ncbi:MAG: ABC transporter ATP-binding protein [Alkalispirochaeta sp.]